jgi:CubicO group peptidase (beta-lactamase class C family)
MMERHDLDGLSLVVGFGDEVYHERYLGDDRPDTVRVAASATKLVVAATLLTLVDDGHLTLDTRASSYLAYLQPRYRDVTLRHMLAHTSGMSEDHGLDQDHAVPLWVSAHALSLTLPLNPPGGQVNYGGAGFANAGLLAETATGTGWRDLFAHRIAGPLGLEDTYFSHPTSPGRQLDSVNVNLSGGLLISSRDYRRILASLTGGGTRILSPSMVAEMTRHQSANADRSDMPGPIPADGGTGLGVWCEDIRIDGSCGLVHSLGAYGALPWIDYEAGVFAVLLMEGESLRELLPDLRELQRRVREAAR